MKINVKIRKYNDEIKTLYFFFSFYVNFFSKIFYGFERTSIGDKIKIDAKKLFYLLVPFANWKSILKNFGIFKTKIFEIRGNMNGFNAFCNIVYSHIGVLEN